MVPNYVNFKYLFIIINTKSTKRIPLNRDTLSSFKFKLDISEKQT